MCLCTQTRCILICYENQKSWSKAVLTKAITSMLPNDVPAPPPLEQVVIESAVPTIFILFGLSFSLLAHVQPFTDFKYKSFTGYLK